jgi:perosamine synthetase
LLEAKITPRTKGIIVVHLFGHPVDMDAVLSIASRYGLFVVEDAAQAHGAEYKGRRVGSLGDMATFSFFGNKIVSTGEGGMVVTHDSAMASKVQLLKNHGMDPQRRYWHPIIGYNYRMTNVAAAIGLAQLEQVAWQLQRRREVVAWYQEYLRDTPGLVWQGEQAWARHVWWMFTVAMHGDGAMDRHDIMEHLHRDGIETRPVVHPLHTLPPYLNAAPGESFPVAERIARCGLNLPTWAGLTREQVRYVCDSLLECYVTPQSL